MNILNLLSETTTEAPANNGGGWTRWLIWGALIVLMIVYLILSSRKRKKYQEEAQAKLNSIAVGDTIKTIGRICGTVQEVLDDGSIVLLTGSENYPSYIRIDREAIAEFRKASEQQVEPFEEVENQQFETQEVEGEQISEENVQNEEIDVPSTEEENPTDTND